MIFVYSIIELLNYFKISFVAFFLPCYSQVKHKMKGGYLISLNYEFKGVKVHGSNHGKREYINILTINKLIFAIKN